jgi:nitrogen fixation-related uncharacterized protein
VSDEYRPIEVVQVGSGPPRAPKPSWRPSAAQGRMSRTELLLLLLVVGVSVGAVCSAFAAWTVHETQQDTRLLNCMYLTIDYSGSSAAPAQYDDLTPSEKKLADRFDCNVRGR